MSKNEFIIQGRWVYGSGSDLLSTLREQAADYLLHAMRRVLSRADDALFERAQQAPVAARPEFLDAMRQLRQLRLPIERAMRRGIEEAFGKLRGPVETPVQDSSLSLLDDEPCDLQRAADATAAAILGVHAPALDAIERRFALLRGVRSLDAEHNPLSAQRLGEALMQAQAGVSLPVPVRQMLYGLYEAELVSSLAPLLSELNARLIGAGILPELGNPRPIEVDANDESAVNESPAPQQAPAPAVALDDAQFNALCDMLHAFRPQEEPATEALEESGAHVFASDEMLSVLSLMQPDVPASVRTAMANRDASLSALLKQELIDAASRIGLPSQHLRISPADEDAVELVGMLFDVMFDEHDFEDHARGMMSRLVVPFVKAALVDRSLFQSKQHPARRLLNVVAEACEGNRGDGPQERELLQKAEQTVARLIGDFNEDVSIFETLEQELRGYLDQYNQRVELAERRAAEAQRGQERLLQAREFAQRELRQRRGERVLPPALDEFLDRHWTHHLSMIALREGIQAPAWQMAVGVAERLLALAPEQAVDPDSIAPQVAQLRGPIETILASSGVTGDAAVSLQVSLVKSLEALARGRYVRVAKPSLHVASEQSGPVAASGEPRAPLAVVADKTQSSVSNADLEFARRLPIGSWLQIPDDEGNPQQVKLSWISPITSRLMFVNRRGVRVLVASVEEVAQMRSEGKLVLRDSDEVFDQAMNRVIDRLQSGGAA